MPETVRIGFVGCGGNARGHMHRLTSMEDVELVGVCDVVEELARAAAERTGAQAYTDHRALLDRGDLHGVYISIPVFAHGQPEMDAIDRKLPFFVEKPVAIDLETARRVEKRVLESKLTTIVGYQLRYAGTVDLTREILKDKAIGLVSGRYWCDTGRGDPKAWVRQMKRSGGQLVEQATHTIDMMRCLIGEVKEVYAAGARQVLHDIDCFDFHAASLKFENGAVGSLTTSWASSIGWNETNILDILYDNARLNWSYSDLKIQQGDGTEEKSAPGGDIDRVFVEALRTGDASAIRSPYSDALKSLVVSLALNRSAAEGRPISIAEVQ